MRVVSHLCPHLFPGCKPAHEAASVTDRGDVCVNGGFILGFIGTTALVAATWMRRHLFTNTRARGSRGRPPSCVHSQTGLDTALENKSLKGI